ncbi:MULTISPECIES: hypothetical protein [Paenibacillus]|uniref:Uncharacterized protein n=1 Tax=Paenibacillus borealis TaxID=160799 RepID=A0ABX3HEA2_PAEBO|nr:hypothetical protein [Paenibacillus borealis]OMD48003.1 hypothetical protein BSK56_11865 [Paenibacillus borealis]
MFNKRWKKVLAWSLSVILVLAIGGLFAANYAVDKLMTSMAGGLDLESDNALDSQTVVEETPEVTTAPTAAATTGQTAAATPDITTNVNTSNDDAPVETVLPKHTANVVEETERPATTESTSKNSGKKTGPVTTKPTSSPAVVENNNLDGYSAQVSADKAKDIQENVTIKEKADVASIVMSQLSVSDIKRLQELASGGLTIEEKREARSIILGKVSEDQYNELSQIAKKYGVSEGKTQEQVLAEEKAFEEGSEQQ